MIAVVAFRPSVQGRAVVAIASLGPLGTVVLQLRFIGCIPPTAILLAIGALAAIAALVLPHGAGRNRGD